MRSRLSGLWACLPFAIAVCIALSGAPLKAQTLTLTQDGMDMGFTLSTFATIDPGNFGPTGPFGVAFAGPDRVMVFNFLDQTRYVFHDTDGQTLSTAITSTKNNPTATQGYATLGGSAYGGTSMFGKFAQYDNNGEVSRVLSGVSEPTYDGMWGNPVTGHILATTFAAPSGSIIDIDPNANGGLGSSRTVTTGIFDGVTVSPDGKIVFAAESDRVVGFSIATGAPVFDSGVLPDRPDGTAVITSNNSLNGDLIINFNGNGFNTGFVGLLDPKTDKLTRVASGGTRGDYASPDPTNGSLFLDYSDVVYRLECGPDCGLGTPEPGTLTLLGSGVVGLAGMLYRNKKS